MSVAVAQANRHRYGNFPVSHTFDTNDTNTPSEITRLSSDVQHTYSAAFDPNDGVKRHAACDECRKRKLKCSGEPQGCQRCMKQKLICHYSEQKQMGRPRKRLRTGSEVVAERNALSSPPRAIQPALGLSDSYFVGASDADVSFEDERSNFENICNAPMARTIQASLSAPFDSQLPGFDPSDSISPQSNNMRTPDQNSMAAYPTDVANWPDFSTVNLPLPVEDKFMGELGLSGSAIDPDVDPGALSNLPAIPACPCLPNLYLTLSTMSTLSSFPFNQQTVQTIEAAYRTARGVIYCPACPQKFDTGSSNLMLGCTLLNVLANHWHRFRRLGVDDLRRAFGTSDSQQTVLSTKAGHAWRLFADQMIRAYVFGDQPVPTPSGLAQSYPTPSSESGRITTNPNEAAPLTLLGLVNALERRQRQWHKLDDLTDEFPDRITPDLTMGQMVGQHKEGSGKELCLEIVGMARSLVSALESPSHPHV